MRWKPGRGKAWPSCTPQTSHEVNKLTGNQAGMCSSHEDWAPSEPASARSSWRAANLLAASGGMQLKNKLCFANCHCCSTASYSTSCSSVLVGKVQVRPKASLHATKLPQQMMSGGDLSHATRHGSFCSLPKLWLTMRKDSIYRPWLFATVYIWHPVPRLLLHPLPIVYHTVSSAEYSPE